MSLCEFRLLRETERERESPTVGSGNIVEEVLWGSDIFEILI